MKRYWLFKGLRMLVFAAGFLAAVGYVVMTLWNVVLTAAAGVHAITFFQAVGLLVLSRILFGGLRGRRHGGWHWPPPLQPPSPPITPQHPQQHPNRLSPPPLSPP